MRLRASVEKQKRESNFWVGMVWASVAGGKLRDPFGYAQGRLFDYAARDEAANGFAQDDDVFFMGVSKTGFGVGARGLLLRVRLAACFLRGF